MLNIVMPMAGRGKRFADAGYAVPKPLIPIHGKPMTQVVIDNLRPACAHRFIFLILQEHIEAFGLDAHLRRWAPGCEIVPVRSVTQGAACTVLLARSHIDNDDPLMIANCDQWVNIDINNYLADMDKRKLDGLIMTMWADDPKWSYCRMDGPRVTEVLEKQVVSHDATVGIYNYRHGRDFVAAAEQMIAADERVNGEFYVAPAYNKMIAHGATIGVFGVGEEGAGMHGLGIPADLEKFAAYPRELGKMLAGLSKVVGRMGTISIVAEQVGEKADTFVTLHARPRRAAAIGTRSDAMNRQERIGIVLQGPLRLEDDFTPETVRLYRRHFPAAAVIVSTWSDENAAALERIERAGAIVLRNAKPARTGPANCNFQIASTLAGIQKCHALGLTYIAKNRTDQRMYAPNAVEFLVSLLDAFPAKPGSRQKARIAAISMDSFKFRLYGLSDHFQFGTVDDMLAFWSVAHDSRAMPAGCPEPTWREAALRNIVETYFVTEYLKRLGRPFDWSLEDSLAVYADYFLIFDKEEIDLYWPKYQPHKEYRQVSYDHSRNTQELTFRDWLLLYSGRIDREAFPAAALDQPYGGIVYQD